MNLRGFGTGTVIAIVAVVAVVIFAMSLIEVPEAAAEAAEIPKFASCSAITAAFEESAEKGYGYYYGMERMAVPMAAEGAADAGTGVQSAEYSETNIQVEGVDEADIVKTDGKYIYTISKEKLVIAEAYPVENARVLSTVELGKITPSEMFIDKDNDTVLIFGTEWWEPVFEAAESGVAGGEVAGTEVVEKAIVPQPYYPRNFTTLQLWDVSDRENPKLERSVDFEGSYLTSRKIGSTVYFVINSYPTYYIMGGVREETADDETIVPLYRERTGAEVAAVEEKEFLPVAPCMEIGYFEPIVAESFVTLGSISMSDFGAEVKKEVVVGSGQNVYASVENLYIAEVSYRHYPWPVPLIDAVAPDTVVPESTEKTMVHKFSLDNGSISYVGVMEAPGSVLNQFSMDEFNGYFRIATTVGEVWNSGTPSTNNVYIFNSELNMVGKLEGLAPGEQIYSARFMGNKAYLVTFKKIDPLFVIDVSVPENPRVLGKLKIPGYSDYLHPIDETHLIGLGKEAVEAEEPWGDFAWYQGIKIAVFDVSDVENPREIYKTEIGDRGTESYALHDHKAFLFDREKGLLVIPVLLAEIDETQYAEGVPTNAYGDYVFQGAYVYSLSLQDGFNLFGRITHYDDDEIFKKLGYYYYTDNYSVKRALYIDDVLYTISEKKIVLNSLYDLGLIKELTIS